MKKEKSCGVICYKNVDGEISVLVIRHFYGGHWSFPKGHVEKGETEEETALREVLEETGATVNLKPGFREVTSYSPAKGTIKDVVFFLGELTNSAFVCQPKEVSELALVTASTAEKMLTFSSDKELLKKAVAAICIKNL